MMKKYGGAAPTGRSTTGSLFARPCSLNRLRAKPYVLLSRMTTVFKCISDAQQCPLKGQTEAIAEGPSE